jgi:voltage-gated sodium channel
MNSPWRQSLSVWLETSKVQRVIVAVLLFNAVVLGLKTDMGLMDRMGGVLRFSDLACLGVFIVEISLRLLAQGWRFWRQGWNIFDFAVVAIALAPDAGAWAVLRGLRVLRILRLLTVVPQLRKVVAAFLHAIPGLSGVVLVMAVFLYTVAVLATNLFGATYPQWFGSLGASLFSLFQIMTLESWSMGIVRPLMQTHPWAWLFFVPFIVIATFTILNLFIGIIVSTMQELSLTPDISADHAELDHTLQRIETDMRALRRSLEDLKSRTPAPGASLTPNS